MPLSFNYRCRVVQRNLVFVIGLSPRLADPEVLKKAEYFGKYGKIYKVVINNHTIYNGAQVREGRGRGEGAGNVITCGTVQCTRS